MQDITKQDEMSYGTHHRGVGRPPLWGPTPCNVTRIHDKASKVTLHPWITLVFLLKVGGSTHMDSWAHKDANRRANMTTSAHTHSTSSQDPPHQRGWVHRAERGSADPTPRSVDLSSRPRGLQCLPTCRHAPQMISSIDSKVV